MQENFEKKDIHDSGRHLEAYILRVANSSMSENQKKKIIQFIDELKIGKVGKKVKSHRLASYLQMLMKLDKYFKKDLDKLTEEEATQFYKDLQDNKIKRKNGMPYAQNTKDLIVRTLKRYLGWAFNGRDNSKYRRTVGWMKEDQPKSNKRAITLEQAEKTIDEEKSIRNKCLFMFLFDSGCRIEEALNVRIADMEVHKRDNGKDEYYMLRIRFSKTKPRRISIPLSTRWLNKWLTEHPEKKPEAFLFPLEYDNARKIIRVMSQRALGFSLSPHELRHSSVTFYVQKFGLRDIAGFYYRFGWIFGSNDAKVYIDEHLIGGEREQEKIIKAVESDRVEQLERELGELKIGNNLQRGKVTELLIENKKIWEWLKKLTSANRILIKAATKNEDVKITFKKQLNEVLSEQEQLIHS